MNSSLATLAVFLIAAMFLSQAQAQFDPRLCCFNYQNKPVPLRNLKSYERTNSRCSMPATIFTTKKDRKICADPSAQWVQDRIRQLS
ncbi:C-C motif chemokine 5-like [Thamnophis elegans]|uniref:C-C motif chemokine 5-like n=1 Tax=Thamnophis elegans TaxID=35005 RepID=UPI0013779626|nr:C-C motif chemokine 5-like [Thamnophis elegans]